MKALAIALALSTATTPALAQYSGQVGGQIDVPYSCSMQLPGIIAMSPVSGSLYEGSASLPYTQSADTDYTMSDAILQTPNGAGQAVGSITFTDSSGKRVASSSSDGKGGKKGKIKGSVSETGMLMTSIEDTVLISGRYTVTATLSCEEGK